MEIEGAGGVEKRLVEDACMSRLNRPASSDEPSIPNPVSIVTISIQ
jgi:hypothetical protein